MSSVVAVGNRSINMSRMNETQEMVLQVNNAYGDTLFTFLLISAFIAIQASNMKRDINPARSVLITSTGFIFLSTMLAQMSLVGAQAPFLFVILATIAQFSNSFSFQ